MPNRPSDEIEPCADVACALCSRPIPPDEPATPRYYEFACSWMVPTGRHRFLLSRGAIHAVCRVSFRAKLPLQLAAVYLRAGDRQHNVLVGPLNLGPSRLSLPFVGLGIDADHPLAFAIVNEGSVPARLVASFGLERIS